MKHLHLGLSITCVLLFALSIISCQSNPSTEAKKETQQSKELVGNDKDNHGCIASAGYRWSELLQECIRPWEKGIKLAVAAETTKTSSIAAAYLIFTPDSSKVEVYIPGLHNEVLPNKIISDSTTTWEASAHSSITVHKTPGNWQIKQDGILLYSQN